jgi:hypothetical protein
MMKSSYRLEASFQAELSRNLIREESRVERILIRGLLSEVNKQRKKAFSEKASVHVRVRWRCSHFDFYRDWVGIKYTHDLSFFSVCRSASKECHARAERKLSRGNYWDKSFDCVLNIDPCLSCSTS